MMTLTIDIPALDRLCAWLESRDKAGLLEAIEKEIVTKLKEAAEGGVPKPKFEEIAQEPPKPIHPEPPKERPELIHPEPPKEPPTVVNTAVTLDAVQRAAAQMRDDGKLKAVTDMFPEFGIKKLSDLKGDQLQAFAERLRAMGAKI